MNLCKQNNTKLLPRKPAGMADSHARTISSKMPRTLTIVAQIISKPAQMESEITKGYITFQMSE
jgi:hypothetical protein